jgi:amino acid adenylation domain-containing protein/non-ribosomal peptide synthase protein (TIGR01720 family)
MKIIHIFFNELRLNAGAIWLENDTIRFFAPVKFQTQETKDFITNNKRQLISILHENQIFSKERFLSSTILRDNVSTFYPLSPAQERLWFIEQYEEGTNAYHIPAVFELAFDADIDGIKYAISQVVSRHEILRSTIRQGDDEQGIQIVHERVLPIAEIQVSNKADYQAVIIDDINCPFDLRSDYPIRVKFYHVQAGEEGDQSLNRTLLLVNMHHIASDGWSIGIFQRELLAFYNAYLNNDSTFSLPALEIQYKDYALWQKTYLTGEVLTNQLNYWKNKLSGYQTLELPTDYARPSQIDYTGSIHGFTLNKNLSDSLRDLAQRCGVTLHTVLLSGINILLSKYTGQDDIIVGSPIANRHHQQTEGLIGFFVNAQANRTLLSKSQSYEELIEQVHQGQVDAQLHQDLPFEKLVDELKVERDTSRHPVFQVVFGVQSFRQDNNATDGQRKIIKPFQGSVSYEIEKFDLSISINENQEKLSGQVSYATSLFHKDTIARLVNHYIHLLDQLTQSPRKPYSQFSLLLPEEYDKIVYRLNETGQDYPKDKTIYEIFQEQVRKAPDNIALVYEEQKLTYQELHEKSNQLARHLRDQYKKKTKQDLAPDTLIALCLDKSLEMVVAILAVLKAGGAYVPIDPSYPQERIDYLLADTKAALVLTQRGCSENYRIQLPKDKVVYVELSEKLYHETDTANLPSHSRASDLAYVIYTSGTTGAPKGVMIEHASVNNLVFVQRNTVDINSGSKVLQFASLVFDASVWEIFSALCSGAELYIIPTSLRQDAHLVSEYIVGRKITVALLPPVLVGTMSSTVLQDLQTLLVGGDLSSLDLMAKWSKGRRLINAYGPTENTVCATMHHYAEGDSNTNIGRALNNVSLYVLDNTLAPVPIGVTGELYIGGASIARGYLNNKELTAERFITNPFATETDKAKGLTRLYKTGDLVRWLSDGNLEYVGRNDDQVKIRGYRIELGEIENALAQIAGIEQSCVLAKERKTESGSTKYLVGYYVLDTAKILTQEVIQEKLSTVLPEYMVPAAFVAMDSFPLTINGKLDKRALPDPDVQASEHSYVAPNTEAEIALCKIWQDVLGLEKVGITDDFFRIGGNSILAIQVSHKMSKALACDVKVAEIFKKKTVSQLLLHSIGQAQVSIHRSENKTSSLSFSQERLWFIEQYEEGTNAYHIPLVFELAADTDIDGIKFAINKIIDRHEVLRTTIEQEANQEAIQIVHEQPLSIQEVQVIDQGDYQTLLHEYINLPFDLSSEYPIRIRFYRISREGESPSRTILLVNMHHIASDGWSVGIFQRELFAFYQAYLNSDTAIGLPSLEIQYKDYARWQKTYLTGEMLANQLNYWKEKLSGYQTLELPTDYVRPSRIDYAGASQSFTLSKNLSDRLRGLAQRYGVTLHTALLSSVNILLSKYTGQEDIVVGSPIANRHHRQTEGLIGFFVNTQASRTLLSKSQSYEALIQQVHQDQASAQLHQDLPFEKLVDELKVERDTSRHPVFQVMFDVQSFRQDNGAADEQKKYIKPFQGSSVYAVEKFDLSISLIDGQRELKGYISYATSLFHKDTIARLVNHYIHLLEQLTNAPQEPYSQFNLLLPEEFNKIVYQWNDTNKEYLRDKTIYQLFQQQVEQTPQSIALAYKEDQLTYKELNERSNQLARHIREQYRQKTEQDMKPDTLIALCLDRSLEMVIGILAVLKAGGAYVPIDPTYPQERIDYLLNDTQAALVLTQRQHSTNYTTRLPKEKVVYVDLTETLYNENDAANLPSHCDVANLAYVIYTSGTTGKPKGVMVQHNSFSQFIYNFNDFIRDKIDFSKRDILSLTNYVFDIFGLEYALPLTWGGKVTLSSANDLDSDFFESCIVQQTPSTLFYLVDKIDQRNNVCIVGGEALQAFVAEKLVRSFSKVINVYGPTETVIWSTAFEITDSKYFNIIGKPLHNESVYVLNAHYAPVPIGVTGELYIGGASVARGYLNNKELTAERFIANPFATEADKANGYTRLYKTGDLVRWLVDGNLEYIGRNDDQVKIRGHRIELAEIENALAQVAGIRQSCVLARERKTHEGTTKYLVGYYVLDNTATVAQEVILEKLSSVLPDYMVPAALIAMDSFPLTINGKLDRRALPDPDLKTPEQHFVAPATETEMLVCAIWQEVLGLEKMGITDDFFKIGGNSILALRASHKMSQALACDVRVAEIFKKKTVAQLLLHSLGQTQVIIPKSDSKTSVLSFAQERLWFIEQYEGGSNAYHMPMVFELSADTNSKGLAYAIDKIIRRHEILRSTIEQGNDQQGIQTVHEQRLTIEEVLTNKDEYLTLLHEDINHPFDLSSEYPIRIKFYRINDEDGSAAKILLLVNMHHIASDGWSIGIFQRELFTFYKAYLNNDTTVSLPPLEIQYKDYARWQKNYLSGEVLANQLNYWKNKLSGYQTLELPTDYPRPSHIDYTGSSQNFTLNENLSDSVRRLAQRYGVTLHTILLSSVNILLSKYTGQEDIVVGSPIANRHHRQTEGLIGFFVNTQANRTLLHESQSYEDLIQQVHQDQIAAQLYQDLPFEKLVDELKVERDTSRHPVFQVVFSVQNFKQDAGAAEDERKFFKPFQGSSAYAIEKFDLSISINDSQGELKGQVSYSTRLFREDTISRLVNHYIYLLEQLTQSPAKPYSQFSLLHPQEYDQIVYQWNDTLKEYPEDKTIHVLFRDQAQKTPNNIALVYEEGQLTYQELDERSNCLARHLREQYRQRTGQDMKPDTLIALCLDRSLEMVVAILAVLKAGGAYVPIDPSYPQERIDYLLSDTQAALVLIQRQHTTNKKQLPKEKVVCIDLTEKLYEETGLSAMSSNSAAKDLAYVIYTSGTTGKPKGVMVQHSGVINLIEDLLDKYAIASSERFLLFANYIFDASVEQMLLSLLSGGTLFVIDNKSILDSNSFTDFITHNRITHLHSTPSYLSAVEPTKLHTLKRVVFGGEHLSIDLFRKYGNIPTVINEYGPTETIVTSHVSINSCLLNSVSIQNIKSYVLDKNLIPVPIGAIGELYIGGAGLARGYLNNEKLTAECFISNPYASESDKAKGYIRMYKTGDLVRWLANGNLEYIGRSDNQVKIRGYRIELGEIEHALTQIKGIKQSCVLTKEKKTEAGSTKYLAGYYVLDSDGPNIPAEEVILEQLSMVLPDYMVPATLVAMESFPLTVNGKLDRRALPDPDVGLSLDEYVAPTNETEKAIVKIWQDVLGLERIGITDNFFRRGGDSILSIQIANRIRQKGFSVQVKDIFSFKTIEKLSSYLNHCQLAVTIKSEQGILTGPLGLLPIQQWFVDRVERRELKKHNHWNQSFLIRVSPLEENRIYSIIKDLVNYHDILRVQYLRGETWQQRYQPSIEIPILKTLNVSQYSSTEIHQILSNWQSEFDLEQGPIFQAGYLYGYEDGSARIYLAIHHMIVDGVSWRILAEDFKALYSGISLPPKGSSYRQWIESVKRYTVDRPEERSYWQEQLRGLPFYQPVEANHMSSTALELSQELTKSLLQEASNAYHTEINDLLLTALAYALKDINERNIQGITLEGHGREAIDPAIDHSHLVGWFTSLFPVRLELQDTIKGSIQHIKESLRGIPNKGIGFGAFATEKGTGYTHANLPPISFNYLGQFGTQLGDWQLAAEDSGVSTHPANEDHHLININGMVSNGKLKFSITTKVGEQTTLELSNSLKKHLTIVIDHCCEKLEKEGSSYTPSDFKAVQLSQSLLDELQYEIDSEE